MMTPPCEAFSAGKAALLTEKVPSVSISKAVRKPLALSASAVAYVQIQPPQQSCRLKAMARHCSRCILSLLCAAYGKVYRSV